MLLGLGIFKLTLEELDLVSAGTAKRQDDAFSYMWLGSICAMIVEVVAIGASIYALI
jgi:hypothetical protein